MLKSMTGFGLSEATIKGISIIVEIRSFNHRFKDIQINAPKETSFMDQEILDEVKKRMSRGRVEVSINFNTLSDESGEVTLNVPLARKYAILLRSLMEELNLEGDIKIQDLLAIKDIILVKDAMTDIRTYKDEILELIHSAIDGMVEMRETEGYKTQGAIEKSLKQLEGYLEEVEAREKDSLSERKTKLKDRLSKLTQDIEIDESRLYQELIIMAEKSDIKEETHRIKGHLEKFWKELEEDGPIGRKLIFLSQEILRETNTLCAKCMDLTISRIGVDMKDELERIREQLQNIE